MKIITAVKNILYWVYGNPVTAIIDIYKSGNALSSQVVFFGILWCVLWAVILSVVVNTTPPLVYWLIAGILALCMGLLRTSKPGDNTEIA